MSPARLGLRAGFMAGVAGLVLATQPATAAITYVSRAAFEANLGASTTDTYDTGYEAGDKLNGTILDVFTDSSMSAVFGQTQYRTTGFADNNLINGSSSARYYCGGCNGSFVLDFTATSFGTASGVYGVGFDFFNAGTPTYAMFVTYGDGSTEDIALGAASIPVNTFFGLTSSLMIRSIAFGLPGGVSTQGGNFGIDDLTIGSAAAVPTPGSLALVAAGLGLMGGLGRRAAAKRQVAR